MTTITFDTHKFIRRLEAAGFESRQAEAVANAFQEAQGEAEIATRLGIERLEAKLNARFERVDGELRLNRWTIGMLLAGVASIGMLLAGVASLVLMAYF